MQACFFIGRPRTQYVDIRAARGARCARPGTMWIVPRLSRACDWLTGGACAGLHPETLLLRQRASHASRFSIG